MGIRVILTGATGMAGEGVLLECLANENVSEVLMINRRHYESDHPKLKELLVPDFNKLQDFSAGLENYDACFFCAGISSVGMKEELYRYITYDTTIAFAKVLVEKNPGMVFTYISGAHTDGTENGRVMWARVKGKTENALTRLGFKAVYNFRPGGMSATPGQKNAKQLYVVAVKIIKVFAPGAIITLKQLGEAMINSVVIGYPKTVLEVIDIKRLANG